MLAPLILLAAAAPAPPLQPSGPWNVRAEASYCMLSRTYGPQTGGIEVGFQPAIGGGSLTVVVLSKGGGGPETGEAKLTPLPGSQVIEGRYYSSLSKDRMHRLTQIFVRDELFTALDALTAVRIKARPIDYTVAVVRAGKAKPAFRKCEDGLLESWGIKPATVREGTAPVAQRPIDRYFRPNDYPAAALQSHFIGQVRAALVVGADGLVKDCKVVTRVGPAFDAITCQRARLIPFTPGLDEHGMPAQSLFQLNVRWAMP